MKDIIKAVFVSLLLFVTAQEGFAFSSEAAQAYPSSDHSSLAQLEGGNDQAISVVEPSLILLENFSPWSQSEQVIHDLFHSSIWSDRVQANEIDENHLFLVNSSAGFPIAYRLLLLFPFHSFP